PDGRGAVSTAGLDFYRELVDELLAADIEPHVTLYHWDLPQALEDDGGWPARVTAERFAAYAEVVGRALGDRVRCWGTVNEPWCSSMLGYSAGVHAPGRHEPGAAVAAAHHLLLGHGLAVDALRGSVRADAEVAVTLNPYPVVAASGSDEDLDAARRVDGVANRLWFEPVLHGAYPEDVLADLSAVSDLSCILDGDLGVIARPIDALGVNYYRRHHVRFERGASAAGPTAQWPGSPDVGIVQPPGPATDGGWAIEPDGLHEVLTRLRDQGAPPLYVHEAGAAFHDAPGPDGEVHDRRRIGWLDAHVRAAHRSLAAGVDLRGFFAWSLLDNFEWAEGYAHRFGLVHVDFDTLARTPKDSARWFGALAGTGELGEPPGEPVAPVGSPSGPA
ncbi:MAG TPA: family 1 glycosylhydrolase, partial [Aquihabitans sp.]|nr:family 1 glycosylhydrolase [Aquihabitans sp.]